MCVRQKFLQPISLATALTVLTAWAAPAAWASGYAAVWRPGSGTQWVKAGIAADEFKTQDLAYFNQGLRIASLAVRDGRFTAVWQPGTGTQWVHWDLSTDDFKAKDSAYFKQGLRIAALSVHNGRLAAVWRPGTGTQWVHWGLSDADFKARDSGYFAQGLRITQLEVDGGRIAAVWRPGTGAQWVHWGLSGADMEAKDGVYFPQGLRLTTMAVDGGKYAAVWRPGSGAQYWSHRRCGVDFKTEDMAYFSQGLRLGFLKLQDESQGAYQYPWKNGVSRSVGQGNNNPPPGSHNGSQSFAFDFMLPSGTEVRAARAGTVEWMQQSQTASYDPSAPTTPANTPFPNGSLQNWGNTLRIRHLGGFTSWYFHLTPNSAKVKVGDKVVAGTVIALSDNTGRTTGPHLHFQVQADSADWGQSVAISFNNCQVPNGGDTVTSQNGNPN
jgi:murein DD-endopeptidase MepM/ murein hydrolase activator NlpD